MKGKIQASTLPFVYKLYIKVIEQVVNESLFFMEIVLQLIEDYGIRRSAFCKL